jgi:hypothetical protein
VLWQNLEKNFSILPTCSPTPQVTVTWQDEAIPEQKIAEFL